MVSGLSGASGASGILGLPRTPPPGYTSWHTAKDVSTFTLVNTNEVTRWNDKSGKARDYSISTATNPILNATAINGRPGIIFDGTQFLTTINAFTAFTGTLLTVYLVGVMESGASNDASAWASRTATNGSASNSNDRCAISRSAGSNNMRTVRANLSSTVGIIPGDPFVATALYNGANGTLYIGSTAGTPFTITAPFNYVRYRIGADTTAGLSRPWQGAEGEIIVYEGAAHDATQRAAVWSYLNSEWGL